MTDIDAVGRNQAFFATHKGERKKFWKVEHFNVGPGWMCGVVGAEKQELVGSGDLTDIEPIDGKFDQIDYLQSIGFKVKRTP